MIKSWNDRRVLITGASGFIGDALSRWLYANGAFVVCLVNELNHKPRGWLPDTRYLKFVHGDVRDRDTLMSVVSYHEIDTIYHLAAYAIVRVAARDPVSTYETNVMGTVNVLDVARVSPSVNRVIVASSDKAYGDHVELPYVETFPLVPKNTYDTSKACMDMIAQSFAHNYDMSVCVTRCSNVYGPRDMNLSRIVPNTIRRISCGQRPILYDDVSTMEREFIYIDDVVDAYTLLGEKELDHVVYNIGGTGPIRIYDLVEKISGMMGFKKGCEILTREAFFREIRRQYIDASRLESLGWRPKVSLDLGLEITIKYYENDGWL